MTMHYLQSINMPVAFSKEPGTLSTETEIENRDVLLRKIASSFDFGIEETNSLIRQVYADARKNIIELETCAAKQMRLSKIMVHKCIFIISSQIFNEDIVGDSNQRSYSTKHKFSIQSTNMPLSYWAIFILNKNVGFAEPEIADLLNISLIKVRERLRKALSFSRSF